jgi:hypothetical protein
MTRKDREAIRRLIKGDHLTSIYKTEGGRTIEEYFVGYNGNSPLRMNNRLAQHLIRLEYVEDVAYNDIYHSDNQNQIDYILSTKVEKCGYVLEEITKYSLGDTVEYNHLYYGKGKGVITEQLDAIGTSVCLNGITNRQFLALSSLNGITRMVLIEKKIKNREADNTKILEKLRIAEEIRREEFRKKRAAEDGNHEYIDEYGYGYRDFDDYDDEEYYLTQQL